MRRKRCVQATSHTLGIFNFYTDPSWRPDNLFHPNGFLRSAFTAIVVEIVPQCHNRSVSCEYVESHLLSRKNGKTTKKTVRYDNIAALVGTQIMLLKRTWNRLADRNFLYYGRGLPYALLPCENESTGERLMSGKTLQGVWFGLESGWSFY